MQHIYRWKAFLNTIVNNTKLCMANWCNFIPRFIFNIIFIVSFIRAINQRRCNLSRKLRQVKKLSNLSIFLSTWTNHWNIYILRWELLLYQYIHYIVILSIYTIVARPLNSFLMILDFLDFNWMNFGLNF